MTTRQNSVPKLRPKLRPKSRPKSRPKFRPKFRLRAIEQRDILAITEIYALYVETSYASFETIAPDVKQMRERMKSLNDNGYPALVAVASEGENGSESGGENGSESGGENGSESGGEEGQAEEVQEEVQEEVMGYAYTAPYKTRNAYKHTIENSIYVKKCYLKLGIGKALLEALIAEAARRGFWQMIATIGKKDGESSIKLHEALGFRTIGTAVGIGYKFEQLVDVVYMQKKLAAKN